MNPETDLGVSQIAARAIARSIAAVSIAGLSAVTFPWKNRLAAILKFARKVCLLPVASRRLVHGDDTPVLHDYCVEPVVVEVEKEANSFER